MEVNTLVQGRMGWLSPNRTCSYRVGGQIKNVMTLGVRTFWMTAAYYMSLLFQSILRETLAPLASLIIH